MKVECRMRLVKLYFFFLSLFVIRCIPDITNATPVICFMGTFTARGLKIGLPGDGTISIDNEGKVPKFVNEIIETTFSADQAMRNGQRVYYFTERAVFRKTADHDTLELIEIAPGIDLEKDILAHMEFKPVISPNLKIMDERIFKDEKMNIRDDGKHKRLDIFKFFQ